MASLINIMMRAIDLFFIPFKGLAPFWGMFAVSAVTGVLMVFIYKYTSNQAAIARVKELIKAHLLEAWIFREQVGVMLRAQAKALGANLKYMALNLKPLAVMALPVLILLINLNFRYGLKPLETGKSTIIKTTRAEPVDFAMMDESIEAPDGVIIETPAMRIPDRGETSWRLRIAAPGAYVLKIKAGGVEYDKTVSSGRMGVRVAPLRSNSLVNEIFYPGEPAMPDGPLKSIEVGYEAESPTIPGTNWQPHWIIQYLVLSVIFGFAVKGPLGVEI